MRIIVTFLYTNSDVNYNYILVSKDVLQLSGKKSNCPVSVTVTVHAEVLSTHGNSTVHQAPVQELVEVDSKIPSRE